MIWQKILSGLVSGLLCLALLAAAAPVGAADPDALRQEAVLYSMTDLGPVDQSPKRVTVEVFVTPQPELNAFHRLLPQAWQQVAAFYAQMGILLDMVPGTARPGSLSARKRLRLEALSHREWLKRTFQAFKVEPQFRPRFMLVCQDKYAFAHLNLSTIHIDFKHFQRDICSDKLGEAKNNPERLARLIIHELGHLFGLYHAHEFVNDPVPEFLPDGETANFMSHYLAEAGGLGFVDFQRRLIHSYLSGGQVFLQYEHVDFDPLRYLELLKQHNNYQEPES
ncbi:MAG: hypothetical protein ACOC8G_00800 [Thermodesulfobacteriota bacterium]